jgi:TonB family protein
MLALILAMFAAVPAGAPAPNTVSPLTIPGAAKGGPIAATVDMASDENDGGDFTAIWPASAYFKGGDGHVTLSCLIDTYGLAERCQVADETPRSQGFGKAALELRPTFKLKPASGPDGQPVNATMAIRVTFKAPKKYVVGTVGESAAIRGLFDLNGLVDSQTSQAGNPLKMRAVTMLDDPVWVAAASFDDLAHAYPSKGGGVEGYAAAHCRIERSGANAGALRECQIIKEAPYDHDFGKAALSLTDKFRLAPTVLARAPSSTPVWVDVPIRLVPPAKLADRTIMAPVFLVGVDPAATPKLFPPEAVAAGLTTGRGVARCTVGADGAFTACAPEPGEPDGLGFSEAAVKIAAGLKINLWSADAAPVEGGVVHIPVRLKLKGG